jgi:hypothetical protein
VYSNTKNLELHNNFLLPTNTFFTYRYKLVVAEAIHEKLEPLRRQVQEYMSEPQYIEQVLDKGFERASVIAQQTWQDVKTRVGLELNEGAYENCQLPNKRVL